jgi:hypothetical protein
MSERSQEDQGSQESELVNPWRTLRSTRANGLLIGQASAFDLASGKAWAPGGG